MNTKPIVTYLVAILAVFAGNIACAEVLAVKVPTANIRSGPGTKHDILWKVEKFHPLSILRKSGQWYRFRDFEGDEGWIHKSLLGKIPAVIAMKEKCNVRSGPGRKHDVFFTVEKGIPFKVIKRKGDWVHVRHSDGDQGWIHRSLVWPAK